MNRFLRKHVPLFIVLCGIVALFSGPSAKAGPISFSEDFSGTLNPLLEDVDSAFALGGGVIRRASSTGDADRHYVRTVFSGYNTVDFVAELTFTLIDDSSGFNLPFIGLGSGVPDPSFFSEPGDAVYFRIHPVQTANPPANGTVLAAVNQAGGTLDSQQLLGTITTSDSTHRVRLAKLGNELTFSLDENFDGTFVADMQTIISDLSASAPFLDGSNSRIFFGTGETTNEFDDLSITAVPEPSSLALVGCAAVALIGFRRGRG